MSKVFLWSGVIESRNHTREGGRTADHRQFSLATRTTNPKRILEGLRLPDMNPLNHCEGSSFHINLEVIAALREEQVTTAMQEIMPEEEQPYEEEQARVESQIQESDSPRIHEAGPPAINVGEEVESSSFHVTANIPYAERPN